MSKLFAEVVSEVDLQRRVSELATEITADYEDRDPVLVGVLHGSLPFLADLCHNSNSACRQTSSP